MENCNPGINDKSSSDNMSIDLTEERDKTAFNKWYLKEYFEPIETTKLNDKFKCFCVPKINILSEFERSTANLFKHLRRVLY